MCENSVYLKNKFTYINMQGKDMLLQKKEITMASFTVSTAVLREKARLIRTLLETSKATHQSLWQQMANTAGTLPSDIHATHEYANNPWNSAVETHYQNYYQLALAMEAAADAYERGDKNVQLSFTPVK
jgi:uncharacterized protein YukE